MLGHAKVTAIAAAAAFALSGCGGGGSAPQPATQTGTAAPSLTNRTVYGTATLSLALPKVLTGKNTSAAVRAVPGGTARSPQYVNPSPNPSPPGPCNSNILDIWVDGTLLPALDNLGEAPDSICVQQTPDSTQTITLPLYSTGTNEIVAVEWDAFHSNVLSIGETDYGGFPPGSTNNLTLTMQMNATGIGITDLGFVNPQLMSGGIYSYAVPCPGTSQFGLYSADANGNFVPIGGYGGTATPTATGSPVSGTTKLAQSTIPGVWNVAWDATCDGFNLQASLTNPAYAIWYSTYYGQGTYPGIQYLYQNNINGFDTWFTPQLGTQTVTKAVTLSNGG